MPQEHQVLRCFSCETFQAHIVKKAKKWECKMCGTKQSFKRNYGKGNGKDCRAQVMKLNELRMHQNEPVGMENMDEENEAISAAFDDFNEPFEPIHGVKESIYSPLKSKWSKFLDKIEESNEDDEQEFENNFTWEVNASKRKRKNNDWDMIEGKKNKLDTMKTKKTDFGLLETSENYKNKFSNYDEHNEIENNKIDRKQIKIESNNPIKRKISTNSKWGKYSDYLENDSEKFEEPKPKKVLSTFNQLTDNNIDEILDL